MNVISLRWQCIALVVLSVLYLLTLMFFLRRDASHPQDLTPTTLNTPAPPLEAPDARINDRFLPPADPPRDIPDVQAPIVVQQSARRATTTRSPFPLDHMDDNEILDPALSANTVFYVWCGKRWFEFHHYISLLSVMKFIRPDQVIFFYDQEPVVDDWIYNTWLDELKEQYPFIRMRKLYEEENGCNGHKNPNDDFIDKRLKFSGGIYVNEYTIFTQFPIHHRYMTSFEGITKEQTTSFEQRQRGAERNHELMGTHKSYGRVTCPKLAQYISKPIYNSSICLMSHEVFYPKDIWELDNKFGRLVRTLFYDNPEIPVPNNSEETLIPNIAHMVWLGGGKMDFLFYLSVLSLLYVAEVDALYIHGDGPPTGHYWNKVKGNSRIKVIFRDSPKTVYGTRVNVISHVTDIWRVDFMIKYGGIYVDTDTIWTQKLDRNIRSYDAVGAYDWTYWNHPFPDTINFGVAIGKKNAPYWHKFQKSMDWFIDKDWSWNGLRQPYRIKERHPELVLINPHLQVICYKFRCHPTWWPDYHNESMHHLNTPCIKDWRTEAYAFHFTLPTPPEYKNLEALRELNATMFGEIGMNVIKRAGLDT